MEFINHITYALFLVKGSGESRLRWIVVCALLAASAGLAQFNQPRLRRAQAEQATALQRIDPILTRQQKLTGLDGAANDYFGAAVAFSGNTVIIGAPDNNGMEDDKGSAYVFTRNGATWTLQQKLTAQDGGANSGFGFSVAISGDTVVIGALLNDVGANRDQGSAYVFTRSGAVWTQQQKLIAQDGAANDTLGYSVAISGDTVVVGAPMNDVGASRGQGSAYVFTGNSTVWTQQQKLTANDGAANDSLGGSVAISGDTVVVGENIDKVGATEGHGSAYVFTRNGTVWTQQQKLIADDGAEGDQFGRSVAISGDTLVVGAPFGDIGGNFSQGSAYVFTRSGAVWTLQQKLTADDGEAGDFFGLAVALNGDTLVVGAVNDHIGGNVGALGQGSAYVFSRSGTVWTQRQKLIADDGAADDRFGSAVAFSGDTVVIGARLDDIDSNRDQGSVYVFVLPDCDFSVEPINHAFPSQGGNGVVNVNATDGWAWTAAPKDSWITITSGATGSGDGAVRFAVAQNPNAGSRRGTLTVAGRKVTVVQAAPVACVNAASFIGASVATESIVAAFGSGLANSTEAATTQPLPTTLGGTQVSVLDSQGTERFAPLFFVSPAQINFQVPPGTVAGQALVTILQAGGTVAAVSPQIVMVSPGLFSADASGQGLAIGVALRVKADGSQSFEPVARFDEERRQFVAAPIDLDSATDNVFLVLFGTGLRNRSSLGSVNVKIGGINAEALYAGPQGSFVGLDQLNVSLPRSLAGSGDVDVNLTVNGMAANRLKVAIK